MSLKSMGPEKRRASIHFLSFNPFFAVLFAFLGGVCVNLFIQNAENLENLPGLCI